MNEDLKQIVSGLNQHLEKNYTLISFKALNADDLLQVLSDLLSVIGDSPKIDMREENLEQSVVRILSLLRILKYQPKDASLLRQKLVKGEQQTIYAILHWLLSNLEMNHQRMYLARFLVKVDVPEEYLQDQELAALHERYLALMEEFKLVHKEREAGKKDITETAELKADLRVMEKEREIILDRIDKVKARTASSSNLLEVAQELRLERERNHELIAQRSQEKDSINSLEVALQRAERKLQVMQQADVELTPEILQQTLLEKIMILKAICNERLPAELSAIKSQVNALNTVVESPYTGPDDIIKLRQRLEVIVREVQALAETKVSEIGADKMAPFRQQAAAIAGVKRNMLEKLEKVDNDLADASAKLQDKREKAKFVIEDSVPKGDDLKRYVAKLKTKSDIYKRCRAELAKFKIESGIINRTLVILDSKYANKKATSPMVSKFEGNLPDNFTEDNAAIINAQLSRNISTNRVKLLSLVNELEPLRQTVQDFEEKYEQARRSYDSIEMSIQGTMANIKNEIDSLQQRVDKDTEELTQLEKKLEKMRTTKEKLQHELGFYANSGPSLRDKLMESIANEEKKIKVLKEEEKSVGELAEQNDYQIQQWTNLVEIFKLKLEYFNESKRKDGIVLRGNGTETLILQ